MKWNLKWYIFKKIGWKLCFFSCFYHCLTVALACGGSASENQTYLVQSSVTTLTSPCTYTICPCSANICRIRFDFTVRILTGPKRLYHKWQIKSDAEKALSIKYWESKVFSESVFITDFINSHCYSIRSNLKKMGPLQFCLPVCLGIHRDPKTKRIFLFAREFWDNPIYPLLSTWISTWTEPKTYFG